MALEQVIPQVQQELGALIKKPKLSTKLLSKPPFRFLHDIFFAVMRATGFGEGLYEEHELNGKVCMHTVQPTALSVCLGVKRPTHALIQAYLHLPLCPPCHLCCCMWCDCLHVCCYCCGLFGCVHLCMPLLQTMKDRGIKIAFLEKTIANIESVLGEKLDVRPQKIVAGAEPENTNEMLLVRLFTCLCTMHRLLQHG